MPSLADTLRMLNDLVADGVFPRYALGGAMAMIFWAEPTITYDLDVFVLWHETASPVVSLEPLYHALRDRGFETSGEHVLIHGTPVQFLVSPNELADEAIESAVTRELDGVPFWVMSPEHLCALWLQAGGAKRRERVAMLRQSGVVDEKKLKSLLRKYRIAERRGR